jgi:hypothetical protein
MVQQGRGKWVSDSTILPTLTLQAWSPATHFDRYQNSTYSTCIKKHLQSSCAHSEASTDAKLLASPHAVHPPLTSPCRLTGTASLALTRRWATTTPSSSEVTQCKFLTRLVTPGATSHTGSLMRMRSSPVCV